MFRATTARRLMVASVAVMSPMAVMHADPKLDPRIRPFHVVPSIVAPQQVVPLELVATGMRRKSFYVVAVDVYMCGLNIAPSLKPAVKKAPQAAIDVLMSAPQAGPIPDSSVCITLHFVRDVTTAQCVDAFRDAFKGCSPDGISKFAKMMTDAVGNDGCKIGEEINFYWMEGGGLFIDKAGTKAYVVQDAEIERRLMEVYLDPSRTVSPDLVKSFNEFLAVSN